MAFLHPRRIQIRKKFQISHRKIVFSMRNIISVGIYFFEDSTWQVRDINSKGGDYKLFKQWCITWHIWIFRYMYKQVRRVQTVTLELELLSGTVLIFKVQKFGVEILLKYNIYYIYFLSKCFKPSGTSLLQGCCHDCQSPKDWNSRRIKGRFPIFYLQNQCINVGDLLRFYL